MTKGTASFGRMNGGKSHIRCRRCGHITYNLHTRACASCGFGATAKMRKYNWTRKIRTGKRRKE